MDALPIGFPPIKMSELLGGYCWQYRFENGYGASVVLHDGSYGHEDDLFELLLTQEVVKGNVNWKQPDMAFIRSILESEPDGDEDGCYGYLTAEDVARILGVIRGYENKYARSAHQLTLARASASWDGQRVSGSYLGSW